MIPAGSSVPCGTTTRYTYGCRCAACKAAHATYNKRNRSEGSSLVPAAPVRRHLLELAAKGVGKRAVADASDVPEQRVFLIRSGRTRRVRAYVAARLLAIDAGAAADAARIDASPTWRRIEKLVAEGFTKKEIARRMRLGQPALYFGRRHVTVRTAYRVQRFYDEVMAC